MNLASVAIVKHVMRMELAAAAAMLATALVSAQDPARSGSLERTFVSDGHVRMDLSAADYRISGSPDTRVRIDWSVRDPDALRRVHASAEVRGREISISTDGPTSSNLKFMIQVPVQSDLYVRLTAGDLRIEGIRGNKDVELRAGDLDIDVGRADDYQRVDASLWAGDLHAPAFHVSKEGLFRSFDWNGNGKYRLHAHLMAGDLRLFSKSDESR
jgi:hypothetical protein